ncbi:MAG TPA: hypothetical protein VGQ59_19455, partial [Cyclobacteriaceae bacterium]|nr:hypothetical protein [Cyclobacteriaceae bacterium]
HDSFNFSDAQIYFTHANFNLAGTSYNNVNAYLTSRLSFFAEFPFSRLCVLNFFILFRQSPRGG